MNVSDIMTRQVVWVSPETEVREVWRKVFSAKVNAIPVIDAQQKLIGIISKEDILEAMYPNYQEYFEDISSIKDFEEMENKVKELGDKRAREIMCKRAIYTHGETPIMRALSRMIVRGVNQLPVLSAEGKIIGMVTKGDIFYALFRKKLGRSMSEIRPLGPKTVRKSKKASK